MQAKGGYETGKAKKKGFEPRYAITFAGVAELHHGSGKIGKLSPSGFSAKELRALSQQLDDAVLVEVSAVLPEELREENEAVVLYWKDGVRKMGLDPDALLAEQKTVIYDTKYFDPRRKRCLNKRMRHNICYGPFAQEHSEDYWDPTVVCFDAMPQLGRVRGTIPLFLGPKARNLNAEGNFYFHSKSGIGYHGDGERRIVICLSLGSSTTLRYNWRLPGSSTHTLKPVDLNLNHGDIYIMSAKAVGRDWRCRSKVRVVHAAGISI